jgi:hypothetical protein
LSTATRSPLAMICSIVQVKSGNSRLQTFEVLFLKYDTPMVVENRQSFFVQ